MAKKKSKSRKLNVYSNLARKRKTKKDAASRKRAEYLAGLPKHPVKRALYRMHPKNFFNFWFSKRGGILALKIFGVAVLVGVLLVGGLFAYFRQDLDAIRPGEINKRVQTTVTKYVDRNGELLWEDKGSGNYKLVVDSDEISDTMKQAIIAIEDQDFYEHNGVSLSAIFRAAVNNLQGGAIQGGSTLTQQLVDQVFFSDEQKQRSLAGIPRKIKESILAIEVERMYDKGDILTLYLNESPFGGRRNGVESAAQTYFGKPARDLNLPESALLAGMPNQPSLYDPYNLNGHEALINRQHKVLNDMTSQGFITQEEADAAKEVPILDTIQPMASQYTNIKAPHFVQMVQDELKRELGEATVGQGGLTVKTTLDLRIQERLDQSMDDMFSSGTPEFAGFRNGAATVEDTETGQIVAMMGSRDFNYPGFGQDNAALGFIQPGSTIKPFVYAELFSNQGSDQRNYGSGSILADDDSMEDIYGAPLQNADGEYRGDIDIRKALAISRNVPAVKAMHVAGVQPTLETTREMGNKYYCTQGRDAQAGLSAAIGGCGTRQIDHVNAFATLARMGVYKPTTSVLEVKNSQGEVLDTWKDESQQVLDPQVAYIVSDILNDDNARAGLYGPNFYGLQIPGVQTAAKTGTSDKGGEPKDLWTMSYSPALTMGVWLGNPDTAVLDNGNSSIPAQIIGEVMEYAHKQVYAEEDKWDPSGGGDWYSMPEGVQTIRGELYPSWYEQNQDQTNAKLTFDRVSKKLATDCTPDRAQIEVDVRQFKDPITDDTRYLAPDGYDPRNDDDIHDCDDRMPAVSISGIDTDSGEINIQVASGSHGLDRIEVKVNGSVIQTLSSAGGHSIDYDFSSVGDKTVSATVIDDALYSGSDSRSVEGGSAGDD